MDDDTKSDFSERLKKFVAGVNDLSKSLDIKIDTSDSEAELHFIDLINRDKTKIDKIKTECVHKIDDIDEGLFDENYAVISVCFKCLVCGKLRDQDKMIIGEGYDYPMCFRCHDIIEPYEKLKGAYLDESLIFPECYKRSGA